MHKWPLRAEWSQLQLGKSDFFDIAELGFDWHTGHSTWAAHFINILVSQALLKFMHGEDLNNLFCVSRWLAENNLIGTIPTQLALTKLSILYVHLFLWI